MTPTWMIEELERRRREREAARRPTLHVDEPEPLPEPVPVRIPAREEDRPSTVVVIEY